MLDWKGREFCQFSNVTLLAAHRDTQFAFIKQANVGDMITLDRLSGPRATYRVTGFQTLRWDRFALPRTFARLTLGLVTCCPFGTTERGPLRIIGSADAVS